MAWQSITAIATAVNGIMNSVDELFSSDHELSKEQTERLRERVKVQLAQIQTQTHQIQINMEQAKHPSLFVAGARPALLWIFAIGLGYNVILHPLIEWVVTLIWLNDENVKNLKELLPGRFDLEELGPLVAGILGLAGWRSWEKRGGVARENMLTTPDAWVPPGGEPVYREPTRAGRP